MEPLPVSDLPFDGIDGSTGEPLHPPLTVDDAATLAQRLAPEARQVAEAAAWRRAVTTPHLGTTADPKDLSATGWGAIFPRDTDPAVIEALKELLDHRRQAAGDRFRLYTGEDGYRPGEKKDEFLARHGVGPGPADPDKMPYYLLLVGDPEQIPWTFQHQIDLQYALGRIAFDTAEDYACYARSVVKTETRGTLLPRRAVFFGVENPGDMATQYTARYLVQPLAGSLAAERPDWSVETVLSAEATKARLGRLLGCDDTPAFLFTACHGMGFPAGDPRQLGHQGALLCQDWPGRAAWKGPLPPDHYFAGDDVAGDARLGGLISFHYACHAGGTPQLDAFPPPGGERRTLAPQPFAARLPRRLLSHPRGGALAVVGHVERTWGYSFLWDGAGQQPQVFEGFLTQLLDGFPIGAALESFALRYAELAEMLASTLEEIDFGATPDAKELCRLWTARSDARAYVLAGDPAVRLPAALHPPRTVGAP
jgi:hypothetical protein